MPARKFRASANRKRGRAAHCVKMWAANEAKASVNTTTTTPSPSTPASVQLPQPLLQAMSASKRKLDTSLKYEPHRQHLENTC